MAKIKLDFQNTYIHDNKTVVWQKAIVTFIKFGVLKSQNFKKTTTYFSVLEADASERYVKSVLGKDDISGELLKININKTLIAIFL